MLARVLTAVVLIPLVVAVVLWAPLWFVTLVASIVIFLALYELFGLGARMGFQAYQAWTFLCVAGILLAQWSAAQSEVRTLEPGVQLVREHGGLISSDAVLLLFALGAAAIGVLSKQALAAVLPSIGVSSAGILLVAWPLSFLVRLQGTPRIGPRLVIFTLALVWAGDVLAYFAGHFAGRVPLAPALSPKKTWEGAVANLVGSLIVAVFFAPWLGLDILPLLGVATFANVAGQVGDLIESSYKRGAGVKDSGGLLPGHGGMLDRVDSLILATPVVWLAVRWIL